MAQNTCNGCSQVIASSDYMKCKACNKYYDLSCLGIETSVFNSYSQDRKDQWLCPSCSRPKGDNTHTPIRSTTSQPNSSHNATDNVNTTRGSRGKPTKATAAPASNNNPGMPELVKEIRQLRTEVMALKEQKTEITLLRKEVQELRTQCTLLTTSLTDSIKEHEETINRQQNTITELTEALQQLQKSQNALEQDALMDEFEIAGIEEAENENLHHMVLITATKLGVSLAADEVCKVYRAGAKRPRGVSTPETLKNTPRPIVVKLLRRSKRNEVVKAARTRRNITSENIVPGPINKVFINERLTKYNRSLFYTTRQRSAMYRYRYCWTSNGCIYVRKAEGAAAIHIRSIPEIDIRIGPPADSVQAEDPQCPGPSEVSTESAESAASAPSSNATDA